jgi:hypothetical protein
MGIAHFIARTASLPRPASAAHELPRQSSSANDNDGSWCNHDGSTNDHHIRRARRNNHNRSTNDHYIRRAGRNDNNRSANDHVDPTAGVRLGAGQGGWFVWSVQRG